MNQMRSNGTNESAPRLAGSEHKGWRPVLALANPFPALLEAWRRAGMWNEGMTHVSSKCTSGNECYSPEVGTGQRQQASVPEILRHALGGHLLEMQ